MRQFGRQQLKDDPGRHQPGEQEALGRCPVVTPSMQQCRYQHHRTGPERRDRHQQVRQRWRAVRFLRPDQLGPEILPERVGEKLTLGRALDRDEPGGDRDAHDDDSGERVKTAQPAAIAVGDR